MTLLRTKQGPALSVVLLGVSVVTFFWFALELCPDSRASIRWRDAHPLRNSLCETLFVEGKWARPLLLVSPGTLLLVWFIRRRDPDSVAVFTTFVLLLAAHLLLVISETRLT